MNRPALSVLGGLTAEEFLRDYWQKKPLLVRNAFNEPTCPLSPEELAGLALEEDVEARIIQEKHADGPWHLSAGPFDEEDFLQLPATHWTLLVQQLDAWVPEVNTLKHYFNFIPYWRIDDIMASYAPQGGSVGPHFDYYDVFLIQAEGEREWRIGQHCAPDTERQEGTPLNIIANFEEQERHVLAPGDMLYLPPRLAHYGIAQNRCVTLSVGFRAPSHQQLLEGFMGHLLDKVPADRFFEDANRKAATHAGEIDAESIVNMGKILREYLHDDLQVARWFGTFATEAKNPAILVPDDSFDDAGQLASSQSVLFANEGSRLAWLRTQQGICLFIDGEPMDLGETDLPWIQSLCDHDSVALTDIPKLNARTDVQDFLFECVQQGSLLVEEAS